MLHGRAIERSAVDRLLTGARAGSSAALVLRGEAGIGKTALLGHAAASAAALGLRVLRCAGTASEAGLPFAALHLLLRPCLPLIDHLPAPQAAALSSAFGLTAPPDLPAAGVIREPGTEAEREPAGWGGPGQARFLVGMAVLTLLTELAREAPLLCVVDDAHRLDRPSAGALLFAARRLGGEGVVLLFASEDDDVLDVLPELPVRGLDRPAATALVESATGHRPVPSVLDRLLAESGANPLALTTLASALTPEQHEGALTALPLAVNTAPAPRTHEPDSAGPLPGTKHNRPTPPEHDGPAPWAEHNGPTPRTVHSRPAPSRVERVFRARIERLPAPTRALLLVAAADDTGLLRVAEAAAAAFGSTPADLTPAEKASLVRVSGASIVFRHPLIRLAAYQRASMADRMAAHRALAAALHGPAHAGRRAWHQAAAATGPDEKTAGALETAARHAADRRAHATAAAAYERAAELSTTRETAATRLAAAARAAFDAGHLTRTARLAEQAHHLRDAPAGRSIGGAGAAERLAVARLRAAVAFEQGFPGRASRILVAGAAGCTPADASVMLAEAARAACYAGDTEQAREIARRLDGLFPVTTPLTSAMASLKDLLHGVSAAGVPQIRALIDDARRAPLADHRLALLLASAGVATADHRGSYELADALVTACRASGRVGSLPGALLARATAQTFLGHHRQAEATAVEGLRLARATGQHHTAAHLTGLLSWLSAVSGRDWPQSGAYQENPAREDSAQEDRTHEDPAQHDTARDSKAHHDPAHDTAARDDTVSAALANWARGLNDLTCGRYTSALDRLTGGWSGISLIATYLAAPDQVEAAVRCAQPDKAATTFRRFDAWAAQTGQPTPEALAHRCRALLMPPGTPDDDRRAHFEAALCAHRRDPQPYEQARTELVYGQWLRRTRRKRAARDLLEAARVRFDHLGARPWARRAAAELRATGDPRPGRAAGNLPRDLLTAQERQIAGLASRGVSNRDIAVQLFLSPRTVGNHLYNIFRKLGITSRRDLGPALGTDPP